jgi:RNA polymerase sigma factor (sigma-70 family)
MERTRPDDPRDPRSFRSPETVRFEELYADVAPALYAWAELRIRPALRSKLEPQDLLQEVWLRGRNKFAGFDERSSGFRAWAFRIGKNILMEAMRASRNDPTPGPAWSSATGTLALDGIPESVTSFTQRLAREESLREFLLQAGSLEETDRMLLIHCGLEQEACATAAPKLGLSEDAAIKRWQRLKAKLREAPWSRALLAPEPESSARPRPSRPPP